MVSEEMDFHKGSVSKFINGAVAKILSEFTK